MLTHTSGKRRRAYCLTIRERKSFCTSSKYEKKEVYQALNGYNESNDKIRVEAYDLRIRTYKKGYLGYILKEPLLMYRDSMDKREKRKFKYRINETKVRHLKLPPKV